METGLETRILLAFVMLRLAQQAAEHLLARANRRYARDPERQRHAAEVLGMSPGEMARAFDYADDRYGLGLVAGWAGVLVQVSFLSAGGLGWVEAWSRGIAWLLGGGVVVTGLAFFAILGLLATLFDLPFALYRTFRIEEKHGFNRQTPRGFVLDLAKGLGLGAALGGLVVGAVLLIMEVAGSAWWVLAWAAVSGFSLVTAWVYPTLLAPIFNKFTPLPQGELRERIVALAERVGFRARGIFVMDASRRTAHGNAYFTGLFRDKRIVLFDTLVLALGPGEVAAVLAHELGHFKLNHVRSGLLRGVAMTGALFFALSRCLPLAGFYRAFGLDGPSAYGALVVFGLWFGLADFLLQPALNWISRRNELAADAFAVRHGGSAEDLVRALLVLREKSRGLPLSHPLFSRVYHSHPPLLERLRALGHA